MEIAWAGEAYESFQAAVELICQSFERSGVYYMTQITPEDKEPPFDAWLVGGASGESEWGDEVRVIRCQEEDEIEPNGPIESVRVDRIYIY